MNARKAGQHSYLKQPPGPHQQPEPQLAGMTGDTFRPSLTVWERELMEILLSEPKQMDKLAKLIDVEDMQTDTARNLYGLAQKIYQTGALPSFDRLMLEIDTPEYKNLLVNCDEQAQAKAQSDIDLRRKDLLSELDRRQQKNQRQHNLAQLKRSQLQPQEEEQLLAKLFASRQQEQTPKGEDSTPETQN